MARESKKTDGIRWRLWFGLVAGAAACVSTGMAALRVSQYVTTDPQFTLRRDRRDALIIEGLRHASRGKVLRVFANDFGRSIFSMPLAERRRRLLAIDWIEDASVSRIWPDRLVVRIRERQPVAFVFFRSGVLLIDRHGVLLEPPAQAHFAFPVLSGIREDTTEAERAIRVSTMLGMLTDLGDFAKDVSEVNANDPENLRLISQVDGRAVELILGDTNFARRYQNFLVHFPEIRKRSPGGKTFDLRIDGNILAKE